MAILANCDKGLPEYLKNKGFTSTDYEVNRSRFNLPNSKQFVPEGAWIIPIQNIDDLSETISIQYIPKDGKIKFQLSGFKKENGVIFIQGDDSMQYIAIGTGAATCYSFFTARGCTTIAAFDDAEMVKKCVKIANLFPEKKVLIIGDNDTGKGHTKGQNSAHIAAGLTNGFAIIPLEAGDWDDYRQTHDKDDDNATNTRFEIERQINVLTPIKIDIKDDGGFNTGLDIHYPIKLKNGKQITVHDAMTNHTFYPCYCPLSTGGSAMINAGFIWSFEKKLIKPVLTAWHNNEIIDECKAFPSTEGRIKWVASRYLQTNNMEYVYALVWLLGISFGSDILTKAGFDRLLKTHHINVEIPEDIIKFICCLVESRINGARKLTELNLGLFKNRLELEVTNRWVDWPKAMQAATSGKYKMVVIKLPHGMAKTQGFILPMMAHANTLNGGTIFSHRENLVTQTHNDIVKTGSQCLHYKDAIKFLDSFHLNSLGGLVCCIHSLVKPRLMNRTLEASYNIFDESSQVLKALYTDSHIEDKHELPLKLSNALKQSRDNGSVLCLADADQTTQDVRHWQEIAGITDDETLIITAQKPVRNFTARISCSTARKHYRSLAVKSMKNDIANNIPIVIAVESEKQSRIVYALLSKEFPDKVTLLFSGTTLEGTNIEFDGKNLDDQRISFIKNIVTISEDVDIFIHTSVMASGVSVEHISKRFQKGYLLLSCGIFSATEALQMMRRFRDITLWEVAILFRKMDAYMVSYYKDNSAKAIKEYGIQQDTIADQINFSMHKNKALIIPAFIALLRDEYGFTIESEMALEQEIPDIMTSLELCEEDKKELINAGETAPTLDEAKLMRQNGYKDRQEKMGCAYTLWCDHFNINNITDDDAELICTPSKLMSVKKMDILYKILTLDSLIKDVQIKNQLFVEAGFTLSLFNNPQLTQDDIRIFRDKIALLCAELAGFREQTFYFLSPRYGCVKNIPDKEMIKFIKKILIDLGFNTETKETRSGDRDRELVISVPRAMIHRLGIEIKPSKHQIEQQELKDKALAMRKNNEGYGAIAKALDLKDRYQARRLVE